MVVKKIGTIYASENELTIMNQHSDRLALAEELKADAINEVLKKRIVDGEVRYYADKTHFKTVRGNWFEVRIDGEYATSKYRRTKS